jgi:glyoxalase family protein
VHKNPLRPIVGLHHVTAIASDPQRNLDFYTEILGLRFIKRTINFDDPGSYHFYFGNDLGSPGTILTFFPWPQAQRGSVGAGETMATAFCVPPNSLPYWESRLLASGVPVERQSDRFGDRLLSLSDPDGMRLELIEAPDSGQSHPARSSDVSADHAISGFFGVTLLELSFEPTTSILEKMGFWLSAEEGNRKRYSAPGVALGRYIDIVVSDAPRYGQLGAGSVHHIAFRSQDDEAQLSWRDEIGGLSLDVTPVLDRTYFHSIYFREPGGVLFEIATDPPGFSFDEPLCSLGEHLKLPPWLESKRPFIEKSLPEISLHYQRSEDESQ